MHSLTSKRIVEVSLAQVMKLNYPWYLQIGCKHPKILQF